MCAHAVYIATCHPCIHVYVGVFVSLRTLRGPLDRVKEENPLLFRKFTAECHKLGFPEIIRPCKLPLFKLRGLQMCIHTYVCKLVVHMFMVVHMFIRPLYSICLV